MFLRQGAAVYRCGPLIPADALKRYLKERSHGVRWDAGVVVSPACSEVASSVYLEAGWTRERWKADG